MIKFTPEEKVVLNQSLTDFLASSSRVTTADGMATLDDLASAIGDNPTALLTSIGNKATSGSDGALVIMFMAGIEAGLALAETRQLEALALR